MRHQKNIQKLLYKKRSKVLIRSQNLSMKNNNIMKAMVTHKRIGLDEICVINRIID